MAGANGVAGQVVIEVVAKDKFNLKDIGNGAGEAGSKAGANYGKAFSSSLTSFLDNLKGIINDSIYTFRDPFLGLRSLAARSGALCGQEFTRAFNLASKLNVGRMSTDLQNLNKNMFQHMPSYRPNSQLQGVPYYLMTQGQQAAMRLNPYNFFENYGTGTADVRWMGLAGFGRQYREMFKKGMDSANWVNNRPGTSLTQALRNNMWATGSEKNPFYYYSGKGANLLSESFNKFLVKPNVAGAITSAATQRWVDANKPFEGSNNPIAKGVTALANAANNFLPGAVNAGVNLVGGALPVVIQAASSMFLIGLGQSLVGLMGAGFVAKNALQEYGDYQQSALRFKTLQPGITDEDYKAVTEKVKDTAASLPLIKAGELMRAVESAQRGGVLQNYKINKDIRPMTDYIGFIGTAASAFANQGYTPESLTDDIIRVGSVFDMKDPKYFKEMLNKLLYGTTLSTSNLKDMIDFMKLQGTQFRARGMTMEESIAEYVSQVNQTGLTGSILASLNRSMERGMQSKQNLLSQLGVATVDDRGVARNKSAIVADLKKELMRLNPGLGAGQIANFTAAFMNSYGSRGAVMSDPSEYTKNLMLMTSVPPDLIDKYSDVATQGVEGIFGRVKSLVSKFNIDIGESIGPEFERGGEQFIKAFIGFGNRVKEIMEAYSAHFEGWKDEDYKNFFDKVFSTAENILISGKEMLPHVEKLIQNLPRLTELLSSFTNKIVEMAENDKVMRFTREAFDDTWAYDYDRAEKEMALQGKSTKNSPELTALAEQFHYKTGLPSETDWARSVKDGGVMFDRYDNIPIYGSVVDSLWYNITKYNMNTDYQKRMNEQQRKQNAMMNPGQGADAINARARELGIAAEFSSPYRDAVEWEPEPEIKDSYIKAPLEKAPAGFDVFAFTPDTKRQLERWVPIMEKNWVDKLSVGQLQNVVGDLSSSFKPTDSFFNLPTKMKVLEAVEEKVDETAKSVSTSFDFLGQLNEETAGVKELETKKAEPVSTKKFIWQDREGNALWNAYSAELSKYAPEQTGLSAKLFDKGMPVPSAWNAMRNEAFGAPWENFYSEGAFRELSKKKFEEYGINFTQDDLYNEVFGRDYKALGLFEKDKEGVEAIKKMARLDARSILEAFCEGILQTNEYAAQDIADDYGIDSPQYAAYQRGLYRKDRMDKEFQNKKRKEATTKTQQDRIDLEKRKIERAENRAQRKFQLELDKRNKAMEQWRTDTANEFNFRVNEAQQYHAQEVSGALGSLKGVIGNSWGYISNAEVKKAMEFYDPTKPMSISEILENQQLYGTADPRKVAYMKSVQNMQDLANGKAFQEQMWYEYIDAVTQGGTTNEFKIDNGAIVFNIPKLDSIKIEKSQVSIMAEKVEAFLDEEIKDDIKAIREYCDEQGNPISV